jgi:hypothetical protein
MQAGMTQKQLTFRDVFTSTATFLRLARTVCIFIFHPNSTARIDLANSIAAEQHWIAEAPSEHGPVSIVDPQGTTKRLEAYDANVFGILEEAERVFFGDQWCSRQEFEQIVEDRLADYCGC